MKALEHIKYWAYLVLSNLTITLLYISKIRPRDQEMPQFCSEIGQKFWQEGHLELAPQLCLQPAWAHMAHAGHRHSFQNFFQRSTGISELLNLLLHVLTARSGQFLGLPKWQLYVSCKEVNQQYAIVLHLVCCIAAYMTPHTIWGIYGALLRHLATCWSGICLWVPTLRTGVKSPRVDRQA